MRSIRVTPAWSRGLKTTVETKEGAEEANNRGINTENDDFGALGVCSIVSAQ